MSFRFVALALALVVVTALITSHAVSQEGQPSEEEMAKMMERYQAAATPGKHHEALYKTVGKWDVAAKFSWGGPGAPVTTTKGEAEFKKILGGRFVVQEYECEIPDMGPMQGYGISGYDNYRKRYVSMWLDTWQTGVFTMYGHATPDGKKFHYYGEMDEPGTLQVGKMSKFVMEPVNDDKFILSAYDLSAGEDAKVMELTYTRKK